MVRHKLVQRIILAYEAYERKQAHESRDKADSGKKYRVQDRNGSGGDRR